MSRLQGILAAGGLTGIVMASSLALGAGKLLAPPTETPVPVVESGGGMGGSREQEYQKQIEAANGTILQLEAQINAMAAGGGDSGGASAGGGGGGSAPAFENENESEDAAHEAEQAQEAEEHAAEQAQEDAQHEAEQQQESESGEGGGG